MSAHEKSAKTFIVVGHGGSGNRGCEAIIRSTVGFLRDIVPNAHITVVSWHPRSDKRIAEELNIRIVSEHPFPLVWFPRWARALVHRVLGLQKYRSLHKRRLYEGNEVLLSVGGDNFTAARLRTMRRHILDLEVAKDVGLKCVVWSQNIEPTADEGTRRMLADTLQGVACVYVRDEDSQNSLADSGVLKNVVFAPDIAFRLRPQLTTRVMSDVEWIGDSNVLGASLSGFDLRHTSLRQRITFFSELLMRWIDETGFRVLLVPHVVLTGSMATNDFRFMKQLAKEVNRPGQVRLMQGHLSAPEYKAAITCCKLFMGTRMHATIAAVSQCIPTLSLSYSHKSVALQQMLLGHDEFSHNIYDGDTCRAYERLQRLWDNAEEIKCRLHARLRELEQHYEELSNILRAILLK